MFVSVSDVFHDLSFLCLRLDDLCGGVESLDESDEVSTDDASESLSLLSLLLLLLLLLPLLLLLLLSELLVVSLELLSSEVSPSLSLSESSASLLPLLGLKT